MGWHGYGAGDLIYHGGKCESRGIGLWRTRRVACSSSGKPEAMGAMGDWPRVQARRAEGSSPGWQQEEEGLAEASVGPP